MAWPQATDYNAAVQNPRLCFRDDDLRRGQTVGDVFGLPRPHSGNFADVYHIQGGDGQDWAIKCFTRPSAGLRLRYQAISDHLRRKQHAFMVEFDFLNEGVRIHGQWYPLLKMRWLDGFCLNEFIREHLNKPAVLEQLGQMWVLLARRLRHDHMAHGDLQHGNVLLVPGSKGRSLALKLIDYDGMFVPALADRPSGEVGHPSYQHPRRPSEGGYNQHMDRFAHLLIYTALRCLRVGGADLWQRYDNQENLLFRAEDFLRPSQSRLLRELWGLGDRPIHRLVGHLLLASQGPLCGVPALDDLVDQGRIRPLSDQEEVHIDEVLDDGAIAATGERCRVRVPGTVGTREADAAAPAGTSRHAAETGVRSDTQAIPLAVQAEKTHLPLEPQTPRRPPDLPRPPPSAINNTDCSAGQAAVSALADRPECPRPLLLRLERSPPEVGQESTAAAEAALPSIRLAITTEGAPLVIPLTLLLYVGDVIADSKTLLLEVRRSAREAERGGAEQAAPGSVPWLSCLGKRSSGYGTVAHRLEPRYLGVHRRPPGGGQRRPSHGN